VSQVNSRPTLPAAAICERALVARDARFDGIFYVGITTTRVYCRPTCPARVSHTDRRRFFDSAASAERAGFRPCLRCRPELAPGRAPMDAVPRLARVAADRIGAGALNGHSVADLATELGVSARHLRRALEREIGVSPLELAQTHRLLLAKRLLADTALPVTRIAFASGFQSLRRFNSIFRERYRLSPGALRRQGHSRGAPLSGPVPSGDLVPLTLAYRPPLAWDALLAHLGQEAMPGVEVVERRRYSRTVWVAGRGGVVVVEDAVPGARGNGHRRGHENQLTAWVSAALLPVLMPLLARLRQLFDLDAEPTVVDAHLELGGLGQLVRRSPGLRMPGAFDGFEVALGALIRSPGSSAERGEDLAGRVVSALGEPLATEIPGLTHVAPTPRRIAGAGPRSLEALGVERRRAENIVAIARAVLEGTLRLELGGDASSARRALMDLGDAGDRLATIIVMRALRRPDAFPASDPVLQRAAGVSSELELRATAERWRPWRGYAALHLWRHFEESCVGQASLPPAP